MGAGAAGAEAEVAAALPGRATGSYPRGVAELEIVVDRSACRGSQSCVRRAPRTFSLDSEGRARAASPPGDPDEDVLAAAQACPYFAIEVRRSGEAAG